MTMTIYDRKNKIQCPSLGCLKIILRTFGSKLSYESKWQIMIFLKELGMYSLLRSNISNYGTVMFIIQHTASGGMARTTHLFIVVPGFTNYDLF